MTLQYNPGTKAFVKVSECLSRPGPSDTIVFLEENTCSLLNGGISDGYLQVASGNGIPASFPDVPGSYHMWGCGMSFVDGHASIHQWVTPILKIPSRSGFYKDSILAGPNNLDWQWFTQHASCPL